jgi:diguanylate cyclase (GGDEF)-like protein
MPLQTWPKPFTYFKDVRVFLISVSIVTAVLLAVIFAFRDMSVNRLLRESIKQQAGSYANLIVITRHWNARYGGVYVEKKKGVDSNPYLKELGINPDITTTDGRVFTLRNPAIMTREISELARENRSVQFHMISLRYVNPENAPDAFERKALEQFERGVKEVWQIDRTGSAPLFRYVMPLIVEKPCLACHARQGYKVGDIRGGVSVNVPAEGLDKQIASSRMELISAAVVTIGLLLCILYFMTWKLVVRLDDVQKRLKHIAVTDELTGLKNRRYIMEQLDKEYQRAVRSGAPLSLILLDIDHFKRFNDAYGHAVGDTVLKIVAVEMRSSLRTYDLLGRIGGEEFLIASPGSVLDEAAGLAERILEKIRNTAVSGSQKIAVTMSAGVTSLGDQDAKAEALLARADAALYMAKQAGRDRVIVL